MILHFIARVFSDIKIDILVLRFYSAITELSLEYHRYNIGNTKIDTQKAMMYTAYDSNTSDTNNNNNNFPCHCKNFPLNLSV